jgi:hypothetical protein
VSCSRSDDETQSMFEWACLADPYLISQ